jgi:c(7)-type cytochrome triheme protein
VRGGRWAAAALAVTAVGGLSLAVVAVPDTVRIPKAHPHPPGTPQEAALFSHWGHGSTRCFACHPALFPQAPAAFTHADMRQGRFCGSCHRGGEARAIPTYRCEQCHVAR